MLSNGISQKQEAHTASEKINRRRRRRRVPQSLPLDSLEMREACDRLLRQSLRIGEEELSGDLLEDLSGQLPQWLANQQGNQLSHLLSLSGEARLDRLKEMTADEGCSVEIRATRVLPDFLIESVNEDLAKIEQLKVENGEFRQLAGQVQIESELQRLIQGYSRRLGATAAEFKDEDDAESEDLWFDEEAMNDRFLKTVGQTESRVVFLLDRLAEVICESFRIAVASHLESQPDSFIASKSLSDADSIAIWRRIKLEERLLPVLSYTGNSRVPVAVLRCIRKGLHMLTPASATQALAPKTCVSVHQFAMDSQSDVWLQCEALTICTWLDPQNSKTLLEQRARKRLGPDDIFVRKHVWGLLTEHLRIHRRAIVDFDVKSESSPFVRQGIAEAMLVSGSLTSAEIYRELCLHDPESQVRSAGLAASLKNPLSPDQYRRVLEVITQLLADEQDPLVLRSAMHVSASLLGRLTIGSDELERASIQQSNPSDEIDSLIEEIEGLDGDDELRHEVVGLFKTEVLPQIRSLECSSEQIPVRRWAAQYAEKITALLDDGVVELARQVTKVMASEQGKVCKVPRDVFREVHQDKIGRMLAVLAINDAGFAVQSGLTSDRIRRGEKFGLRLWRLWYEATHKATDKLKRLRHAKGRISGSTIRVPSQVRQEQSGMSVPGEPLKISNDGTWRPFLPLVDDFVSALNLGWLRQTTVSFYTSQGITRVTTPERFSDKIRALFILNFKFENLAELRNWDQHSWSASSYVNELRKVGFEIDFDRHPSESAKRSSKKRIEDESVTQFFEFEKSQ